MKDILCKTTHMEDIVCKTTHSTCTYISLHHESVITSQCDDSLISVNARECGSSTSVCPGILGLETLEDESSLSIINNTPGHPASILSPC